MMSRSLFVILAGIPPEIAAKFEDVFNKRSRSKSWEIIARGNRYRSSRYSKAFADRLYQQLADELKRRIQLDRRNVLRDVNLILLYLTKHDGSESALLERFGTETLIVPLKRPDNIDNSLVIPNQVNRVVRALVKESFRSLKHAELMLEVIAEEVTNRDRRTCLLLPPKNFGPDSGKIFNCVYDVSLSRKRQEDFKKDLAVVSNTLVTRQCGSHRYFVGKRNIVFKSPGKSRGRHGCAPVWSDSEHELSCVLRGRFRFGAPYDPMFHYDCVAGSLRDFPSCHGTERLTPGRRHVNIAPNDNVR